MAKTRATQINAVQRYNKENTTQVCLRLNNNTDKDILDYLTYDLGDESKLSFIKRAIRDLMDKE